MLDHIVLFKFKPETSHDEVNKLTSQLLGLQKNIPEIVSITTGRNFSERSKGYQQGLVVRLKNKTDLKIYQEHPSHQQVLENWIKPLTEDILAVDYEY